MAQGRTRYTRWQKQQVMLHYPSCRTTRDKEELAERLQILDDAGEPSVAKLYNLASRLKVTQGHDQQERLAAITDQDRLKERQDPTQTTFNGKDDRYIKSEHGRRTPDAIAFHLGHTETAALYRARQLGLRRPAKNWPALKVARWLDLSDAELRSLRSEGIDIYRLHDRRGRLQLELVSTTSLWRWLENGGRKKLKDRNPDAFFLLELAETKELILADPTAWESCEYLSYGHICSNPYADSYGLYCPNNERYRAGEDPKCGARMLDLTDLRPDSDSL
jgi:hypothetical protein